MNPAGSTGDADIGQTLAVVGINGWRCCVCNATFPRAFSIEHHMITAHSTSQPCTDASSSVSRPSPSQTTAASAVPNSTSMPACDTDHGTSVSQNDAGNLQPASSVSLQETVSVPIHDASPPVPSRHCPQSQSGNGATETHSVVSETGMKTASQPEEMEGIEARFDSMCVTKKQVATPSPHEQKEPVSDSQGSAQAVLQAKPNSLSEKPEKPKKWICGCGQDFEAKHDILRHHKVSRCELKQKAFICPVCGEGFAYKRGLNRHMEAKGSLIINCPDCSLRFHSHRALQSHREEAHTTGAPLSMSDTPSNTLEKGREAVSNTEQSLGSDGSGGGDIPHVGQEGRNGQRWMCYQRKHPGVPRAKMLNWVLDNGHSHSAMTPWECPKCQRNFHRKCVFRHHLLTCGVLKLSEGRRQFHCPLCGDVFKWLVQLQRHYNHHHRHKIHLDTHGSESPAQSSPISGNSPAPSGNTSTTEDDVDMVLSDVESLDSNTAQSIDSDVSAAVDEDKQKDLHVCGTSNVDAAGSYVKQGTDGAGEDSKRNQRPLLSQNTTKSSGSLEDDVIVVGDSDDDSDSSDSDVECVSGPAKEGGADDSGDGTAGNSSRPGAGFHRGRGQFMFHGVPPWQFWGMRGMRGHGPRFSPPPHPFHPPPPPPPPPHPHPHPHHSPPPPCDAAEGDESHTGHDWSDFYGFPPPFPGCHFAHGWHHMMRGHHWGLGAGGRHFRGWFRGHAPYHRHHKGPADPASYDSLTDDAKLSSAGASTSGSSASQSGTAENHNSSQQQSTADEEMRENPGRNTDGSSKAESSEHRNRMSRIIELILSSCEDGTKLWYCPDCLLPFENKKLLKRHHEENHASAVFLCLLCEEPITKAVRFNKHVRKQHAKGGQGRGKGHRHGHHMHHMFGRGWSPDFHQKLFTDPHYAASVASDLGSDPDDEGFKECPICRKKFRATGRKENFFERHVNSHFGIETFNFKCEECGKTFLEKSKFVKHQQAKHSSSQPYVCSTCGKSYQSKTSLTRHERTHTGERPHKCPDCGEGFFEYRELVRHRATHTGQAAFKCPECGAGFTLRSSLVTHMRYKHTGEKPFTCESCNKGFSSSSALGRHRKICTAASDMVLTADGDVKDVEISSEKLGEKPETFSNNSHHKNFLQIKEEPITMESETS